MEDGHTLFDYNVNINDLIQVLIKPVLTETQNFTRATNNETERTDKPSPNKVSISIMYVGIRYLWHIRKYNVSKLYSEFWSMRGINSSERRINS